MYVINGIPEFRKMGTGIPIFDLNGFQVFRFDFPPENSGIPNSEAEFRIPVVNGFAAHSSDGSSSSSSQHSSDSHHGSSDDDEGASGAADKKSCSSLVPKRQKPKPNLRLPCAANSALKRESNGHITMATEDLLQPGHVVKERWKVVRMPRTLVPFP